MVEIEVKNISPIGCGNTGNSSGNKPDIWQFTIDSVAQLQGVDIPVKIGCYTYSEQLVKDISCIHSFKNVFLRGRWEPDGSGSCIAFIASELIV